MSADAGAATNAAAESASAVAGTDCPLQHKQDALTTLRPPPVLVGGDSDDEESEDAEFLLRSGWMRTNEADLEDGRGEIDEDDDELNAIMMEEKNLYIMN